MTSKQEVEVLMNSAVVFAKKMLLEHGGFHPYGAYLTAGGAVVDVGVDMGGDGFPSARDVLRVLGADLSKRAASGGLLATAIVFDVRIEPRAPSGASDAIQVNLEHVTGYAAEVFFPYRLGGERNLEFFPVFAQAGVPTIFRAASG